MPYLGERKRGNEIGYRTRHYYMWVECHICRKRRWTMLLRGSPRNKVCKKCVKSNYRYERRECPICGKEFMANITRGQKYDRPYCGQVACIHKDIEHYHKLQREKTKRRYFTTWGYYISVKNRARKQGIIFSLTSKEFCEWYEEQPMVCHYCRNPLTKRGAIQLTSESVDRVDSSLGYIKGNLVLACRRCNSIKGNWFLEWEMLEIADKYLKDKPY